MPDHGIYLTWHIRSEKSEAKKRRGSQVRVYQNRRDAEEGQLGAQAAGLSGRIYERRTSVDNLLVDLFFLVVRERGAK